jgi:hypothetical protein
MRTPQDLIQCLNDEARNFQLFHLVVGFKSECQLVPAYAPESEQLRKLTQMLLAGGLPIGFLGYRWEARTSRCCTASIVTRPLPEFNAEPMIRQMLDALAEYFGSNLQKSGIRVRLSPRPDLN